MAADYIKGIAGSLDTLAGGDVVPRMTQTKAMGVSVTEPPCMDLTREGRRFILGISGAATGIAPVQAVPTTAAQWVIFNTSTTRTLFLDMLGVVLFSGTAGATGNVLYAAHFSTPAQTGGPATGLAVCNASGSSTASSAATVKSGITLTAPAAPIWFPVEQTPSSASVAVASLFLGDLHLEGKLAIQPNRGLALAVCGAAGTTPLFVPVAAWSEIESTMG